MSATRWSDTAEKTLLICMHVATEKPINWNLVAAAMAARGYAFGSSACAQKWGKLKRADAANIKTSSGTPTPSSNKSKIETPKSGRSNASFGGRLPHDSDGDDDDDDDDSRSTARPSIRRLFKEEMRKKQESLKIKKESDLGGFGGQTSMQFKTEGGGVDDAIKVDSDDDLYDA